MATVQRGQWGEHGGSAFRFPQRPDQLNCTVVGGELTGIEFVQGSNSLQIGNHPPQPANHTIDLTGQIVTRVTGWVGPENGYENGLLVRGLRITTRDTSFTVGATNGTQFQVDVSENSKLAGFAGRAGWRIDSMGVLVETNDVVVSVSFDSNSPTPITTDVVGAIELETSDQLQWSINPSTTESFTFDKISFYTDQAETEFIGGWSAAEGLCIEPSFPYSFTSTTATSLALVDNESPRTPDSYWYKLWIKANGVVQPPLDPEVINFVKRDH